MRHPASVLTDAPIRVAVTITIVCEAICARCEFRAIFYDRSTGQFYGGSGPTAWAAIAWCLDEYVRRVVWGFAICPARNPGLRPGDRT